jgi:hypothetical protein
MGKGKFVVMELTGAERAAVERHTGKLESVPTDPRMVRVPEEFVDVAKGVEDKGDLSVATATFNRGTGHAEAAAKDLAAKDEASEGEQETTGVPREDSAP